ncbi:MAG TPA: OprD family outer membrane porin [Rubrivivax sp.]|nr:OprD family outer membrane porin [Rubrivivax sp.]
MILADRGAAFALPACACGRFAIANPITRITVGDRFGLDDASLQRRRCVPCRACATGRRNRRFAAAFAGCNAQPTAILTRIRLRDLTPTRPVPARHPFVERSQETTLAPTHPKAKRASGKHRGALATMLVAATLAAPATAADDEAGKTGTPFWDNARAGYFFRASYFDRQSDGSPNLPGSAFKQLGAGIGGWLFANTGELADFLSFGATYNFVVPVYAPEQYPFNFVLKDPDQSGYGVFREVNARARFDSNTVVIGRQTIRNQWFMDGVYRFFNKLDQSMIGARDIRNMNWLNFQGVTIQGRAFDESLRYYGGYVNQMTQVNDDRFRNLYQGGWNVFLYPTSARGGDSNGMAYIGANWKPSADSMVSTSYHNVQNMLNMFYLDFDYVWRMEGTRYFRAAAQWMYQESNGDSLLRGVNGQPGPSFHTNYGGAYFEARPVPWWIPYLALGVTSDRNQIYSPFSLGPSYLIQRIGENSLAGERTWIAGTVLDFATVGLNGLSFDVTYGQRTNRNVNGNPNLPVANWDEAATDLIYVVPFEGFFKNLRARARYAKAWQKGDTWNGSSIVYVDFPTTDLRFDVQLNIPFN